MNRFLSHKLTPLVITLTLILCAVLIATKGHAQAQDTRDYDWVITATTTELTDYFNYKDTALNPIVKVTVRYMDKSTTKGQEVEYEDLFYRGCNPVGLRRHALLNINNTGLGAIRIKHSKDMGTTGETCAAANSIVKLLLDTYLLGDAPAAIFVPSSSFTAIAQDLRHENFYPFESTPDQGVAASVILSLCAEPGGSRQSMYYTGNQ